MSEELKAVDIQISRLGSVVMFTALTRKSLEWVKENVPLESWQWQGPAFAVEHGYADDLAAAMEAGGLTVD